MYGLVRHKTDHTIQATQERVKEIRIERVLLLLWFVLNLIVGALTVHEYGMSVDEPNNFQYASETLRSYPSWFGILFKPPYNSSFDGHGPAFVTLVAIMIRLIQVVFPNIFTLDLWHYSYFITFELTGLCLYELTKRWFNIWTAWGILILFGTQPLLLGHAFMNPKDIPFMFLLTLSIVFGFRMVDQMKAKESFISFEPPFHAAAQKFQAVDPMRRRRFFVFVTVTLTVVIFLFLFSRQLNHLIEQIVTFFYTAGPSSWTGRLFDIVASHSSNISGEAYVTKALRLFRRIKRLILLFGVIFFAGYFLLMINSTTLSTFINDLWNQRSKISKSFADQTKSLKKALNARAVKRWFVEIYQALLNRQVLLAGVTLGLATAVRAIAPFVGLIIFLYLFAQIGSRAWSVTLAYFLIAGVVTYLAWPHLWGAPISRYLEGLGIISNFSYPGRVLFAGHLYSASDLPRSYLPVLLTIQFTEPLILGVFVGIGVLIWKLLQRHLPTDLALYLLMGFAFPFVGLILLNSPLYHNFRQALFVVPAMVMLAAFSLEIAFRKLHHTWVRILLIAVIALPGIYSTAKLYPYEYVYYNSLVGGLAGARDRYELDYWRVSLREMALEMNKIAPSRAKIIVTRSAGLFARYARPDLVVDKVINSILDLNQRYDYLVQVNRWKPSDLYPDVKNVVVIERDGIVLATAKAMGNTIIK